MKRLAAIVLLMLAGLFSASALQTRGSVDLSVYHGCPMEGDARSQTVQALNRLKNRVTAPTPAQIKQKITLAAILVPGYDVGRWKVKDGATITGYVYDVRPGGIGTVNCHARNWADRDTHIELVLDPMDEGAMQRMLFDVEHKNQSENTVPDRCGTGGRRRGKFTRSPRLRRCRDHDKALYSRQAVSPKAMSAQRLDLKASQISVSAGEWEKRTWLLKQRFGIST